MLQTEGYLAEVGAQSDGFWDRITESDPDVKHESSEPATLKSERDAFTKVAVAVGENYQASEQVPAESSGAVDSKNGDAPKFSIREAFYKEYDAWDKKDNNVSFTVGTTSDALLSLGMKDQNIVLRSGTVLQKIKDHPEMTFDIFKGIPELLEHPVIVQFSDAIDPKTKRPKYDSSITVLGELYADVNEDGKTVKKPVLVSLELLPTNQKKTAVLDFAIIKSAYSKNALQQYLNENSILYIDPDKKRTDSWLSLNRLQLPLGENSYGPIRKIAYVDGKVKVQNPKTMTSMQKKLFEAGKIDEFGNKLFSDRDYSYEALTSKPDMVVTTVGGNVPNNRADVVARAKKNATSVGRFDPKTGSVSIRVQDIGEDVVLGRDGLKHSLDRRFDVNAPVVLKAGEILSNSIRINELTPQKAEAAESYVLIGAAKNVNGEMYIVRSVVNRFSNELTSMDVLYAINAKKEPVALLPLSTGKPALGTDSSISIASLLDYVNEYFPDILPEDVLKHYGHDARPDGKLGNDALYQDRDTDSVSNRSLLANALEGVAQNDIERDKIQEYKGKIDLINSEERKLHELNAQIKEMSFAKGPRDTAKIRKLREDATKTANRISTYDKQLLRLEASAPLQKVLEREKKKAYQRAEKKGKERKWIRAVRSALAVGTALTVIYNTENPRKARVL